MAAGIGSNSNKVDMLLVSSYGGQAGKFADQIIEDTSQFSAGGSH